jgi:hypothetical protein
MEAISMAHYALAISLLCSIVFGAFVAPLSAQERKAGNRLVYDMTFGQRTSPTRVTFAIVGLNSDGSTRAKAMMTRAGLRRGFAFDTIISTTGAIVPQSDSPARGHRTISLAQAQNATQQSADAGFAVSVRPINAFADACARRALRVGDSWDAEMDVPAAIKAMYTVTGLQTRAGHNVYTVVVKNAPNWPTFSAEGTYDADARLVASLHYAVIDAKGESITTDVALRL